MNERLETILVADDEPAVLEVCLRVLRRYGYDAVGVENGARALEHVREHPVDLVLSDIKMPDVTGLQVLQQVKELFPDLPVVLITGYGSLETAMHAVRLGASGFVLKPFHADDLRHAVEEALAKNRLWRENIRLKALLPLVRAGETLMNETQVSEVADEAVRILQEALHGQMAWLFLSTEAVTLLACGDSSPVWDGDQLAALTRGEGRTVATGAELEKLLSALGVDNSEEPLAHLAWARLVARDRSIGQLVVGREPGTAPFDEADLETLQVLARQVALALDNAALWQETRRYAEHLEEMVAARTRDLEASEAQVRRLYEASQRLRTTLDLDTVMDDALALALSIAGAAAGRLLVLDGHGEVTAETQRGDLDAGHLACGNEMAQALVRQRQPLQRVLDTGEAMLALPLVQDDRLVAVLVLCHSEAGHFGAIQMDVLASIASQAAAVMLNAQVFERTTERLNKAYQDLEARAEQLEMTTQQLVRADKLAVIGQLAAGISHEMGNIIAPLQVYADLLSMVEPGSAEHKSYVEQIQTITMRARTILRQFTDFARKEKRQGRDVDIQDVVAQSIELLRYNLNRNQVNVHFQRNPDVPLIVGDPGQLEQVFVNLFVNANDAMPQGGDLYVNAVQVKRDDQRGYVQISVRDTGAGISSENLPHIFEPFFTTKGVGKGTGLGLFISYGIVERHGGSFDVDSQVGIGTTFRIRLPIAVDNGPIERDAQQGELRHD